MESRDDFQGEILLVIKEILRLHRGKKVPFKEITLLTATRTRNDAILEAFDQYHIPIVADSGQAHYLESLEVMVMLIPCGPLTIPCMIIP